MTQKSSINEKFRNLADRSKSLERMQSKLLFAELAVLAAILLNLGLFYSAIFKLLLAP